MGEIGGNPVAFWTNYYLLEKAKNAVLLAALELLCDDFMAYCGDGLTETSQPDSIRKARAVIAFNKQTQ